MYRSGHNGADSKSVREKSPASSNLAICAKIRNCTLSVIPYFFVNKRFEQGKHEVLKTVWETVLLPACVPRNAEVSRANLALFLIAIISIYDIIISKEVLL